jgi:branched-chain amino acid transport system permease protein
MLELLQHTVDGMLTGASYALVGLGLTLCFGVLRRLNLAYGAGAMLAAYLGAWAFARYGLPWWAVLVVVVAAAAVIGLYVEWLCFAAHREPVTTAGAFDGAPAGVDSREVVALASSFAIWMQLEQLAVHLLPKHLNPFPSLAASSEWTLAGLVLRTDRLLLALLAVGLVWALSYGLHASRQGLAWRAAAQQRTAAALSGIAVPQVQRAAFAAACATSGLAAFAVLAVEGQVTPMFGMWVLIKGLVAAMLGGLGSVPGVLVGGVVLGIVEAHAQVAFGALGREFAGFALLFAVLVWPSTWPWRGARSLHAA